MKNVICRKVIDVTQKGVTLECNGEKLYIDFNDCVKNFSLEKREKSQCVATRDITTLSFTFYTHPKTKVIFKRNVFNDIIMGKTAKSKFFDMQKSIIEAGYTSYDLS